MESVTIKAFGKINLSLDVLNRKPDGYHEVKMIMQTVELHDTVIVEKQKDGIKIECNSPWVPNNEGNIAYKAAKLLMDNFNINSGLNIKIDKKIPVAAGMAGGSTDAAAVMKAMNILFSFGLSENELMSLGKQLGADVPYCIRGGTMLAEGIGEILTELPSFEGVDIVLVKPSIGVSTAWVYKNLDLTKLSSRPDTGKIIYSIENSDIKFVAENMVNVLETVTISKYGIIEEIKKKLIQSGALGSMMSGSGPTVFGIFKDKQSAEYAYNSIKSDKWDCILTKTTCEER